MPPLGALCFALLYTSLIAYCLSCICYGYVRPSACIKDHAVRIMLTWILQEDACCAGMGAQCVC
jgi:hypothetical protein